MKHLITTLVLFVTMLTSQSAQNAANWFPHLSSTYDGCQRVGFTEATLASNVASGTTVFSKRGYEFLDFIPTTKGACYLTFDEQSKRLLRVLYFYPAEDPRLQNSMTLLVSMFMKAFGKPNVVNKFKEDIYVWHVNGSTVQLSLDDVDDYVTISVSK